MPTKRSLSYHATGVLDNTALGLSAVLKWVNRTESFRSAGQRGRRVVDVGFFASVVDIGNNLGLALCTGAAWTSWGCARGSCPWTASSSARR